MVAGLGSLPFTINAAKANNFVDAQVILLVDVSLSVANNHFEMQTQGIADAFLDPRFPNYYGQSGIAIQYVQWSNEVQQQSSGWQILKTKEDYINFSNLILTTPRMHGGITSISGALQFAHNQLLTSPFTSARMVVDVSGDGKENSTRLQHWNEDQTEATYTYPQVNFWRDRILELHPDSNINGLAILAHPEEQDLVEHYIQHVTGGPSTFCLSVPSFEEFAATFKRKFFLEIAGHTPNDKRNAS